MRSAELTMSFLLEERELPADRLALGIPLYGRVFAVSRPYGSTRNAPQPSRESATYSQIHQLQNEQHWTRYWDDQTKSPWLHAPDDSEIICYDDRQSIAIKTDWAMQKGLRGVFFWQIVGDRLSDGSNPLQQAAFEKWSRAR